MPAELSGESPDDPETVFIQWLRPLYVDGHVGNDRKSGDPLPYVLVNHLDSNENVEESTADALVSVHILTHKSAGQIASRDEADKVHQRLILLARHLEDVEFSDGRMATIDYLDVKKSPKREPYGDELILRRVGRYGLGLSYA